MIDMDQINIIPLDYAWEPPELLAREKELSTLIQNVKKLFPTNLWVEGPTGVGKTVTAKFFMKIIELKGWAKAYYFPCFDRSIKNNIKFFRKQYGIKESGWPELILEVITNDILNQEKKLVLVFDDIQKQRNIRSEFDNMLFSLHKLLKETYNIPLQIILISTISYGKIGQYLASDTLNRYQFKPLIFGIYDHKEMFTLIKQRIRYIYGAIDEEKERLCKLMADKLAYRMGADFRTALDILRTAILDYGGFTEETLTRAIHEVKRGWWKERLIKEITPHQTATLISICLASIKLENELARKGYIDNNPPVPIDVAFESYKELCRKLNVVPQSRSMLFYNLKILAEKGYIIRRYISKDDPKNPYIGIRSGHFIFLTEKRDNILDAISKEELMKLIGGETI